MLLVPRAKQVLRHKLEQATAVGVVSAGRALSMHDRQTLTCAFLILKSALFLFGPVSAESKEPFIAAQIDTNTQTYTRAHIR